MIQVQTSNQLTLSDVAQLLGVEREAVKKWASEFCEHLSAGANPPTGQVRTFNAHDLCALAMIAEHAKDGDEPDEIIPLLVEGIQHEEPWLSWAYQNAPLFRDPPDGLDENSYGAILGGMASRENFDVARSYWTAAKELLAVVKGSRRDPHELDYPILFLARHAIELCLKSLLKEPPEHHDIRELARLAERDRGGQLPPWIAARLHDFGRIDLMSDYFRYGGMAAGEYWVDFDHLEAVMDRFIAVWENTAKPRT
jgi:HEPN domain-containing protein